MPVSSKDFNAVVKGPWETLRQAQPSHDLTTAVAKDIPGNRSEVAALGAPTNTALADLNTTIVIALQTP